MIKLKKDYPYSHEGIRLVEYKEGQETNDIPDEIELILIERGDAVDCKAKKESKKEEEKVVEPKIKEGILTVDGDLTIEGDIETDKKESFKEPEENKLLEPKEDKEVKSPKKTKKKK